MLKTQDFGWSPRRLLKSISPKCGKSTPGSQRFHWWPDTVKLRLGVRLALWYWHKTHLWPITTQDFLNEPQIATLKFGACQNSSEGGNTGYNAFQLAMQQCHATVWVKMLPVPLDRQAYLHLISWISFFAIYSVFLQVQQKNDGSDFEPDTICSFQKTPSSHLGMNIYRGLSFDRINFFNMAHLHFDFTFNTELSIESIRNVCSCFREPIKTFIFWCLSNRLFCTCFRSPK